MRAFLAAVVAAIVIAVIAALSLDRLDHSAANVHRTDNVRLGDAAE